MAVLYVLTVCFFAYSTLNVWSRPGLVASICFASFDYAIFFGTGAGAAFSLFGAIFALLYAAANYDPVRFQLAPGEVPLLAWFAISLISVMFSTIPDVSLPVATKLVVLSGGIYVTCRVHSMRDGFLDDLIIGSCIAVFLCAPALLLSQNTLGRLSVEGLAPVGLAELANIPLVAILLIAIFRDDLGWKLRLLTISALLAVLIPFIVVVATRSVLLASGVLMVLFLVLSFWHGKGVRLIVNSTLGLIAIATFLWLAWGQIAATKVGILSVVGLTRLFSNLGEGGLVLDRSALARLQGYQEAWRLFELNPIFGSGFGTFGGLSSGQGLGYPHNMILELLSEGGLVGTGLFVWALLSFGKEGLRGAFHRPVDWRAIFILGLMVVALTREQVSESLAISKLTFASFAMLAARSAARRESRALQAEVPSRA